MLELEVRRPGSLLSVELRQEITEEQLAKIRELLDAERKARRIETLESFADSNRDLYTQHVRGWFDADTVRAVLPSGEWGAVEG